jgi:hypothetical protein
MPDDDKHPNLADPDFEPTDEQLQELVRRAFAGVSEANARALKALHERIAVEGAEALRKWREKYPDGPT